MFSKEAIEQIQKSQLKPEVIELEGFNYLLTPKEMGIRSVDPTKPATLMVQSLSGLVAYLENANATKELWSGDSKYLIHIMSHERVRLISDLEPKHMIRREYIHAQAPENKYVCARYMPIEDFIITVMASFVPDENTERVLRFVSAIQALHTQENTDDGAGQTVVVKKTVATVGPEKVPNPIELRPYVTFPEINQPARPYVFRIKQDQPKDPVQCALFTVDSSTWITRAVDDIRIYFEDIIKEEDLQAIIIS